MPRHESDARNRDDDQKPGEPPRPATEPAGAAASVRSGKTMTDPGSGEPLAQPPAPNQARADQKDGPARP